MPNQIKKPQRKTRTHEAKTVQKLIDSLGFIIWWNFNGASWEPKRLREISLSLGANIDIKDIPTKHGLTKAVASFSKERGSITAVPVHKDKSGVITIGILKRDIDSNQKKAKGIQIDSVVFDTNNNSFLSKGSTDYATMLVNEIDKRLTHYTGLEFRQWILMPWINSHNGMQMMRGNYYIVAKHEKDLDSLEQFCEACGVKLHILTQANDKRTQKGLETKASLNLGEEIQKIREKLKTYLIQESVREDGISNIDKQIAFVTDKANFLRESLSVGLTSIDSVINDAKTELQKLRDKQPTETKTSKRVLQTWRNALKEEYELKKDGEVKGYRIPFTDFEKLLLPKTASKEFYWTTDQRLPIALKMIGFTVQWRATSLILRPIQ